MSDRSALAAAQVTEQREQGTGDREQGTGQSPDTVAPALSQTEQMDQKETKETKREATGEEASNADTVNPALSEGRSEQTLTPALSQREREVMAERIRQSEALPVGLRTRMAELVLASDSAAAEQAIRAVEAALPGALRIGASDIARPAHPAGEVFFHGDADAVSDERAEALARGQLARSGMLRGQRVRVAE